MDFFRKHRHHLEVVGFYSSESPDEVAVLFRCSRCDYEHLKPAKKLPAPEVLAQEKNEKVLRR